MPNFIFSEILILGTIFLNVATLIMWVLLIGAYRKNLRSKILLLIESWALPLAFFISLGAVLGSLYYSNVVNFIPCILCWYQRILIFPLVPLLGLAWIKNDRKIGDYILLLIGIGSIISLYHLSIQHLVTSTLPCDATGISCQKLYVLEYGYVSIPMMALSVFLAVGTLMIPLKWPLSKKR